MPSACSGNCDVCSGSGTAYSCAPSSSLCTGNCDVCSGSGTSYSCSASQGLCAGNCDSCTGSGSNFNCTPVESLCSGCGDCKPVAGTGHYSCGGDHTECADSEYCQCLGTSCTCEQ
jgi:hypothetical protein